MPSALMAGPSAGVRRPAAMRRQPTSLRLRTVQFRGAAFGLFQAHQRSRLEGIDQGARISFVRDHHVVYHAQSGRQFRARALVERRVGERQHHRHQRAAPGCAPAPRAAREPARRAEFRSNRSPPREAAAAAARRPASGFCFVCPCCGFLEQRHAPPRSRARRKRASCSGDRWGIRAAGTGCTRRAREPRAPAGRWGRWRCRRWRRTPRL